MHLIFLIYGFFMYGLQRVCFGQLRPVEIAQLYEKAWFAVTETCLAMTIFRDEVGGFFLVMFTALVTGKVWGWIGEGRVEVLEQQPPVNPRLFHTRLSVSLTLSLLYDAWLLGYSVRTVIQQARPDMMVMFLFEFAILHVCSLHTALRYAISLVEARTIQVQTRQRLEDRRRQVREQRAEIERRNAENGTEEELPSEEDVDEIDIEVPGWEAKGQWVLTLDLCAGTYPAGWSSSAMHRLTDLPTDFMKLCTYATFFSVLLTFYGLPIHIMRDLFMTTRSFLKRLGALMRYRQAVRDMNKYADATAEELARENTCIVCREEMHLWDPNDASQVERTRPKKLPCGHILHFGCLKSWLERQQVCPTCRRSVVIATDRQHPARNREAMMFRLNLNLGGNGGGRDQGAAAANGAAPGEQGAANNAQPPANAGNGVRMVNLGPLRLGFAQGDVGEMEDMAQRLGMPADVANAAAAGPAAQGGSGQPGTASSVNSIFTQLRQIEDRIRRESLSLRFAQQEAQTLRLLLTELQRVRQMQAAGTASARPRPPPAPTPAPGATPPQPPSVTGLPALPQQPRTNTLLVRLGPDAHNVPVQAGSPDLPEGVTLPAGWSLLPLQPIDANASGPVPGIGRTMAQGQTPDPQAVALQQQYQNQYMQQLQQQLPQLPPLQHQHYQAQLPPHLQPHQTVAQLNPQSPEVQAAIQHHQMVQQQLLLQQHMQAVAAQQRSQSAAVPLQPQRATAEQQPSQTTIVQQPPQVAAAPQQLQTVTVTTLQNLTEPATADSVPDSASSSNASGGGPTATDGTISSDSQEGGNSPSTARELAPSAQPTPVMPNWAGSAQFFGAGEAAGGDGHSGEVTSVFIPALPEEAAAVTGSEPPREQMPPAEPATESEGNSRAATVEEAIDDGD